MVDAMEFRADLYAAGGLYRDRTRFYARHEEEAVEAARQLVVAHGLDHALLFVSDSPSQARLIAKVGAER